MMPFYLASFMRKFHQCPGLINNSTVYKPQATSHSALGNSVSYNNFSFA